MVKQFETIPNYPTGFAEKGRGDINPCLFKCLKWNAVAKNLLRPVSYNGNVKIRAVT